MSLQRFIVADTDDNYEGGGRDDAIHPIDSCCSTGVKGIRFILDIVAFIYTLYTTSLAFIVVLMWAFSILITIYVSISSGETWAQLFAVGLGIPLIGPFINVLDEAFIVIVRTLRVGFQGKLRPHVFEFLVLPVSFADTVVTKKHEALKKKVMLSQSPQNEELIMRVGENINDPSPRRPSIDSAVSDQIDEEKTFEFYFDKFVLFLATRVPPKSFTLQQKLTLVFGALDLITLCVFLQFEIAVGLSVRAFASLIAMLICSVVRFLRSSPKSLKEMHFRLGTSRSARWVKYTTIGAALFILSSCASSGLWTDRPDVYTFALASFAVFFGTLGGLMVLVVCVCPTVLHFLPCLKFWGNAEAAMEDGADYLNLDSQKSASTTTTIHPKDIKKEEDKVIVESVKSRYVTIMISLLLIIFFLVILFSRGSGAGEIDDSEVSAGHRWWALVVWLIIATVAVAHTVGDKERIDAFEAVKYHNEEGVTNAQNTNEQKAMELKGSAGANNKNASDDDEVRNRGNSELPSHVKRQDTVTYRPPAIGGSSAFHPEEDKNKNDEEETTHSTDEAAAPSPSSSGVSNNDEQQPPALMTYEGQRIQSASAATQPMARSVSTVSSSRELDEKSIVIPDGNGEYATSSANRVGNNVTGVVLNDKDKNIENGNNQKKKRVTSTRLTKRTARFFIGGITSVFFLLVGMMTALNFPNTVPANERTYDFSVLDGYNSTDPNGRQGKKKRQPYTICSAKWGPNERFNATDMVLLAKAAYYENAAQVQQALRLWFNEPLNVTLATHSSRDGGGEGEAGEQSHGLGVRAYHITFFEANRSVASGLPANVEPEAWQLNTNVTLPRVDIVAVRGSHNGLDWLQDAYVWGDSIFFSIFDRMSPFSLPQSVVNSLVKWSKSLRYGVFGDVSYFRQLRALTVDVMAKSKAAGSDEILIVGHSLGGGLAQLIGSALEIVAFAVSGVGIGYQATAADFQIDKVRGYQSNIVPAYDPVPQIDLQIGEVQNIDCASAPNPLGCHSLTTTWTELAKSCCDIRSTNDLNGKSTPIVGEVLTQMGLWIGVLLLCAVLFQIRVVKSLLLIVGFVEETTINRNRKSQT